MDRLNGAMESGEDEIDAAFRRTGAKHSICCRVVIRLTDVVASSCSTRWLHTSSITFACNSSA